MKPELTIKTTEEYSKATLLEIKDAVEYVSPLTLARMFDYSKTTVLEKLRELSRAYHIHVIAPDGARPGSNAIRINLRQFRKALFESSTVDVSKAV